MIARGTLVQSQGKGQAFEIQADEVEVLGLVDDPDTYPIQPKQHTLEFLREVAHLRPRTNTFGAVTRVRHTAAQAIHRFFHEQGFFWVNTPIITASDAEGAGQMFRVSTLDAGEPAAHGRGQDRLRARTSSARRPTSPSPASSTSRRTAWRCRKVYTFGPTFRAENSNTTRHLAEFWMIEPEIAFADLNDDADLAEALPQVRLQGRARRARRTTWSSSTSGTTRRSIERLEKFVDSSFERIDYTEAIEILEKCEAEVRVPGRSGAATCRPSTSATSPRSTSAGRWW